MACIGNVFLFLFPVMISILYFESSDFTIGLGDTAVPISFVFICLGMLTFRRLLVIMTWDCSWVADGHFPTLGFLFFGLVSSSVLLSVPYFE